jgi:hypothetical protein
LKKQQISHNSVVESTLILKCNAKIIIDEELEVTLENKVYPHTYYHHKLSQVHINETLAKV